MQPVKDPSTLIKIDTSEDMSLDEYTKSKGKKYLTNDEYREFIKPKIKKSYDEYKAEGLADDLIRQELTDAYGYEDLINEAMGTPDYSKFKNGQFNLKDSWNKQLDEMAKSHPDKLEKINSMRDYDDEKIELARAFMELMGAK